MKAAAILCLTSLFQFAYAQKISDAYFLEAEKHWSISYKAYIDKQREEHSIVSPSSDSLVKNGARNETNFLLHLFSKHKELTNKNLDNATLLYVLKKSQHSFCDYVVWNQTDTIYIHLASRLAAAQNTLPTENIKPFNHLENRQKTYLLKAMDLVSKTNEQDFEEALNGPKPNKPGVITLILDSSTYDVFKFEKQTSKYKVSRFQFNDHAFQTKD